MESYNKFKSGILCFWSLWVLYILYIEIFFFFLGLFIHTYIFDLVEYKGKYGVVTGYSR